MKNIIIPLLMLVGPFTNAQVSGLWGMKEVTVGVEIMTPTAKWTRINEDGTFQSGNGWMQNAEGTWTFDEASSLFLPTTKNWILDEGGPFEVMFSGDGMQWRRMEDGVEVVVTLQRITELPRHPADRIQGLWDVTAVLADGVDVTDDQDPDNKRYALIRWDRVFVMGNTPDGRQTGFWHMNGHRPEVTLLYHEEGREKETYQITFAGNEMTWRGEDKKISFARIDRIPK